MTLWLCGWAVARAAMPLVSVDYTAEVTGSLAEVTVDQAFVNDSDDAIDAVYVFPLHEDAAVDGVHMVVGDREIEAEVLDLDQAERVYRDAVEEGHTAALTTEERPNVFTQRVGNIGPHEEVHVRLRVVQPIPHVDGAYELVLPLLVGPRFVQADADPVDDPPPVAGGSAALLAGIDVRIDAGLPVRGLDCPSHPVEYATTGDDTRLVTAAAAADRDFVLRWQVAGDAPQASLLVQADHLALTFDPPEAPPRQDVVPREIVWVIDQSCSMEGAPIELVRRAMREALEHVDARDALRILRFSEQVQGDAGSRPATPRSSRRHAPRSTPCRPPGAPTCSTASSRRSSRRPTPPASATSCS
ncbi:MAG: VIT and VWA domain-containing protein [Myxococcota bacterium]